MALSLTAFTLLTACGSSSSNDSATDTSSTSTPSTTVSRTISGVAIDPALQGATVFVDRNSDGNLTIGEPSTTTDANGHYELNTTDEDIGKNIVVQGGFDIVTKDTFTGKLLSVIDANSTKFDVTSLSSLVATYKSQYPDMSLTEIKDEFSQKLNVNTDAFNADITKDKDLLQKGMLIVKIEQMMQKDNNNSAMQVVDTFTKSLEGTQDLDAAITDLTDNHINKPELRAKINALHQSVNALDTQNITTSDEMAITIANIDANVTETTDISKLGDLHIHVNQLVVNTPDIEAFQKEQLLKHLNIVDINKTTKEKLFANQDLEHLTPTDLKNKIDDDADLKAEISVENNQSKSTQTTDNTLITGDNNQSNETQTTNDNNQSGTTQTTEDNNQSSSTQTTQENSFDTNKTILANGLSYGTIISPDTGKVWLDRNLGATEACTSTDDEACYGDYYQWGRAADGHEKKDSATTTTQANAVTSGNLFVIGHSDWTKADTTGAERSQNWNPCPSGYRVPTADEFKAEKINGITQAMDKFKMTNSGFRADGTGEVVSIGEHGYYWTTSVDENNNAQQLDLYLNHYALSPTVHRGEGDHIRCIEQ